MKRFIFVVTLIILLLTTLVVYADTLTGTVVAPSGAELRDLNGKVLEIIPIGEKIELQTVFPSEPVRYNNIEGYVDLQEFDIHRDKNGKTYGTVNLAKGANLRENENPKSEILAVIPIGETVVFNTINMLEEDYVTYNNMDGTVELEDFKLSVEPTELSATEKTTESIAKAIYYGIIILVLIGIILGLFARKKGVPTQSIGDANDTGDAKALHDAISRGDITVDDLLKGKVKVPYFTLGVLLSQAREVQAKKKKSDRELLKTQQQILAELKKKR